MGEGSRSWRSRFPTAWVKIGATVGVTVVVAVMGLQDLMLFYHSLVNPRYGTALYLNETRCNIHSWSYCLRLCHRRSF